MNTKQRLFAAVAVAGQRSHSAVRSAAAFGAGGAGGGGAAATGAPAACRGAGRRSDIRVTAMTPATPRAASPAPSATSEPIPEPPASRDTLATGLAPASGTDFGARVGNRPAALPPEVSEGVAAATPTGADDIGVRLAPTGLAGGSTVSDALAAGVAARLAALPATVRLTAVTVVAVTGTVTSAWNRRWVEAESTAPRSHVAVPAPLPQPETKEGAPAPALDCSEIRASGRVPFSVHAPTSHWEACPRTVLSWSGRIPTHRLTGVVAAWKASSTAVWAVPAATADDESAGDGEADAGGSVGLLVVGGALGDVGGTLGDVGGSAGDVGGADGDAGGADGDAGGSDGDVGGSVGESDVDVDVDVDGEDEDEDEDGDGLAPADLLALELPAGDVAAAGVVAAADAGPEVAAGVVAWAAVSGSSGSHDSLVPFAVVAAAAAPPLNAATAAPEAALSRAVPAIKVTARRRPCAIRVPNPYSLVSMKK